jgi:hypothetical protein
VSGHTGPQGPHTTCVNVCTQLTMAWGIVWLSGGFDLACGLLQDTLLPCTQALTVMQAVCYI